MGGWSDEEGIEIEKYYVTPVYKEDAKAKH